MVYICKLLEKLRLADTLHHILKISNIGILMLKAININNGKHLITISEGSKEQIVINRFQLTTLNQIHLLLTQTLGANSTRYINILGSSIVKSGKNVNLTAIHTRLVFNQDRR